MSTGDRDASGNWALLDQLAALRWIQDHIRSFGGDPDTVTLFGEDTGAASATLLGLSPLSAGLFHRIIALSGNPLCAQVCINILSLCKFPIKFFLLMMTCVKYLQEKPREATVELATRIGCRGSIGAEMVECLRRTRFKDLILKSNDMFVSITLNFFLSLLD